MKRSQLLRRAVGVLVAGAVAALGAGTSSAAALVPGVQQIRAATTLDTKPGKSVTATCPAGQQATGAGFTINLPAGASLVRKIVLERLSLTPQSVTAAARVEAPEPPLTSTNVSLPWGITAIAYCDDPLPGYELRPAPSVADASGEKSVAANCSAGRQVLGSGFFLTGNSGHVNVDQLIPGTGQVDVKAFEDPLAPPPAEAVWSVTAQAVCAYPLPHRRVQAAIGFTDSADAKEMGASCLDDEVPYSMGFDLVGSLGRVRFVGATTFEPSGVGHFVAAVEVRKNHVGDWSVRSFAVCGVR